MKTIITLFVVLFVYMLNITPLVKGKNKSQVGVGRNGITSYIEYDLSAHLVRRDFPSYYGFNDSLFVLVSDSVVKQISLKENLIVTEILTLKNRYSNYIFNDDKGQIHLSSFYMKSHQIECDSFDDYLISGGELLYQRTYDNMFGKRHYPLFQYKTSSPEYFIDVVNETYYSEEEGRIEGIMPYRSEINLDYVFVDSKIGLLVGSDTFIVGTESFYEKGNSVVNEFKLLKDTDRVLIVKHNEEVVEMYELSLNRLIYTCDKIFEVKSKGKVDIMFYNNGIGWLNSELKLCLLKF